MDKIAENFFEKVAQILSEGQKRAKTAINLSMVYTYFEIGKMIVEEEQRVVVVKLFCNITT